MSCSSVTMSISSKKAVPTFGLDWAGEYFMLSYQGPEIQNSFTAATVLEDLSEMAECACRANVGQSMRIGEMEDCVRHSVRESLAAIGSALLDDSAARRGFVGSLVS